MPRPPKASRTAAAPAKKLPRPAPAWMRPLLLGLAALLLLSWFSREAGDSDTWWHLGTGRFILTHHRLPTPDPFAWTTYLGKPLYTGEEVTRYFNLTHEWLAQVMLYAFYAGGGLAGLVLVRALCLSLFCGLTGLMAWRRTESVYRALVAALAVSVAVHTFSTDRPQYFTYLFLALTVNLLDARSRLWLLPAIFVVWANCHGGFVIGWAAVGIYCAESLYLRRRGKPVEGERRLWLAGIAAVLASGLNPNGFRVVEVLHNYGKSPLLAQVWEWYRPVFWEVSPFTVLLYGGVAVAVWQRRRVRPAHWLLLAAFGAAGLLAIRSVVFAGFAGAFVIAAYWPGWKTSQQPAVGRRKRLPHIDRAVAFGAAGLILAGPVVLLAQGRAFQFRASSRTPVAAADFLLRHHIGGRLFNTYAQGGYWIWRLWPQAQVFIDGRILNESVAQDGQRILFAADDSGGRSGEDLLKQYGIDVIVVDAFDPVTGAAYYLPAALADPQQREWKLIYHDARDLIYMRRPPPDVRPLDSLEGLVGMEEQCSFLIRDGAPACADGMIDVFSRIGDGERARKWAAIRAEQVARR